jgi:hypothetical protein
MRLYLIAVAILLASNAAYAAPAPPLPDPFVYRAANTDGLVATYKEATTSPATVTLTPRPWRLAANGATLDIAPALRAANAGRPTYGATVRLEVPAIGLTLSHSSMVGSGHETRVDQAVTKDVGLRALHTVNGRGAATTQVGPTIRLADQIRLWYAVYPASNKATLMLTGTARF